MNEWMNVDESMKNRELLSIVQSWGSGPQRIESVSHPCYSHGLRIL